MGETNWGKSGTLELDFTIQGMSCAACAARIEKALGRMEGVTEAAVSFPLRTAWLQVAGDAVTKEGISSKVDQLGFRAVWHESAEDGLRKERRRLGIRLAASFALSLPLVAGMITHLPWLEPLRAFVPDFLYWPWLQLALATIVQFVIGMPFYFGAYYALRQRSANMDVLVAIGTSAAYLYSHYIVFRDGSFAIGTHESPLYFETSAVVMTAILLGKFLETSVSLDVQQKSLGFHKLHAQKAVVERGGELLTIRTEFVRKGDIVHVGKGELVPVDGKIRSGESLLDESLLTGESAPVAKRPGDPVWAGTENRMGELILTTGAAGHDTLLSRIQELVQQSQRAKSSLQSQVDRVAGWFVPFMLLAALTTFLAWGLLADPGHWSKAALCAIAVLLAACPCALGLAAPISLVIASGRLSRRGIVAKEAGVVERLARVRLIVLDKTGTLTEGKPSLAYAGPLGRGRSSLLRLAAALEGDAVHPLAEAIREEGARYGLVPPEAEQVRHFPGGGVSGLVGGLPAAIGNRAYMDKLGVSLSPEAERLAEKREEGGETVLYVAESGTCVGVLGFSDTLKAEAAAMAAELKRLGVKPIVATGDHPSPAAAAAKALGISDVYASMLPERKLKLVQELKRRGKGVAMAGDGWNDAPALAASDVGIAMGNGTPGALGAGHVTLLFSRLGGIPEAIKLSRLTMVNITQNLAFALCYNTVIIPFAAAGYLAPWMAGAAMALSSVSVVLNALRLNSKLARLDYGRTP